MSRSRISSLVLSTIFLIKLTGVGTKNKKPPNPRFRFSSNESTTLLDLYTSYEGHWGRITKDASFEQIGCSKLQAENHIKYLRGIKNKKKNGTACKTILIFFLYIY